jgi:hypothetical protein
MGKLLGYYFLAIAVIVFFAVMLAFSTQDGFGLDEMLFIIISLVILIAGVKLTKPKK